MRVLVIAALLLTGCSDYSRKCNKIIDHTIEVGVRELTQGMSDEERATFVDDVEKRRGDTMDECEKAQPSQDDVDCALRGQTLAEINSCAWYQRSGVGAVR